MSPTKEERAHRPQFYSDDSSDSQNSAASHFLPVLPFSTCSASRKSLLKKEFQNMFGRGGKRSLTYGKTLKLHKKPSIAVEHARHVVENDTLDRWLKKHNMTNSTAGQLVLSNQEFMIFFKWFELKMERHSCHDGINIDSVVDDFVESGLFKKRSEASHFLKSIDSDGNGAISYEEFREGLCDENNLLRVVQFKRFIKRIRFGRRVPSLPSVSRASTTGTIFRSKTM